MFQGRVLRTLCSENTCSQERCVPENACSQERMFSRTRVLGPLRWEVYRDKGGLSATINEKRRGQNDCIRLINRRGLTNFCSGTQIRRSSDGKPVAHERDGLMICPHNQKMVKKLMSYLQKWKFKNYSVRRELRSGAEAPPAHPPVGQTRRSAWGVRSFVRSFVCVCVCSQLGS